MRRTSIAVYEDTIEALRELRWRYRADSLADVIDLLINEAEPQIYHDFICEDEPEGYEDAE